jgi:hypothetical protein
MTGLIEENTGLIENSTGLIENSTGLIEENTGLITETSMEHTASVRRKRSKERGKDSKPRNFPLHTMKNLPQFRDKSHQEVREYILEKKGVDIGSNVNAVHIAVIVFVALVAITSPLWIEKLVDWYNKRKE